MLDVNREYLLFDFGDFNGLLVSGDWSFALGEYFEAAWAFGYYQSTVPTVYAEWVNEDGSEIEQDLKLRIMPATAVVRVLPLGARRAFQPYVGGGLAVYFWRYSETGEFLGTDDSIFSDTFERAARRSGRSRSSASGASCRSRRSSASKAATSGARATSRRTSSGTRSISAGSASSATFGFRF